jgi:hypothetical protein
MYMWRCNKKQQQILLWAPLAKQHFYFVQVVKNNRSDKDKWYYIMITTLDYQEASVFLFFNQSVWPTAISWGKNGGISTVLRGIGEEERKIEGGKERQDRGSRLRHTYVMHDRQGELQLYRGSQLSWDVWFQGPRLPLAMSCKKSVCKQSACFFVSSPPVSSPSMSSPSIISPSISSPSVNSPSVTSPSVSSPDASSSFPSRPTVL